MSDKNSQRYVVATDVGGTCTETIVFAEGEPLYLGKALLILCSPANSDS